MSDPVYHHAEVYGNKAARAAERGEGKGGGRTHCMAENLLRPRAREASGSVNKTVKQHNKIKILFFKWPKDTNDTLQDFLIKNNLTRCWSRIVCVL